MNVTDFVDKSVVYASQQVCVYKWGVCLFILQVGVCLVCNLKVVEVEIVVGVCVLTVLET